MTMKMSEFQETVWAYYAAYGREMPWRLPDEHGAYNPYQILVSEIMLQQTQVSRVVPKYTSFLTRFPTVRSLSRASLGSVLAEWNGLGYNRRAKFLHEAAKRLAERSSPWMFDDLVACKGIGPNTAAAVLVYSYNVPHAFIETNIRTVFIHHFFAENLQVADADLLPLVQGALDYEHPREWHWALMDYGAYLKGTVGNLSRSSKHYAKQSTFVGSKRQVRGQVLRLLKDTDLSRVELGRHIADERLGAVLADLLSEKLISSRNDVFTLG